MRFKRGWEWGEGRREMIMTFVYHSFVYIFVYFCEVIMYIYIILILEL